MSEVELILTKLKIVSEEQERGMYLCNKEDSKILLDYITNLQEENERLKENAEHNDKVVDKAKWNEMIYKSRNEIAIGYIETYKESFKNYIASDLEFNVYELLDILQGSDKE